MNANRKAGRRLGRCAGSAAILLVFAVGVTVSLLWLAGRFTPKVSMQTERLSLGEDQRPARLAEARLIRVPQVETAVGTIRPVHETTIGTKLLARVVGVNLSAGQVIKTGDVLARLDDTDLQARLRQAEAALNAAEAVRVQAEADSNRAVNLFKSKAVSRQEYEKAATALKSADAELSRAKGSIKEIQAMLEWATIRSPMDGIVIDKRVDTGDTVTPGQTLATLLDPKRMQFVASVRESLAHRLKVGQSIEVQLESFNTRRVGTISEIVPEAESRSRAFLVKVTGHCPENLYSGMFGRILIPLDEEEVLVIPRQAVHSVGQLDLVNVATNGAVRRRAVRLGRTIGDDIKVLSGLREGEQVQVPVTTAAKSEASHG